MYIQGICCLCGKQITQMQQWREIKKGICHVSCLTLPKRSDEDGNDNYIKCNIMDNCGDCDNETRRGDL